MGSFRSSPVFLVGLLATISFSLCDGFGHPVARPSRVKRCSEKAATSQFRQDRSTEEHIADLEAGMEAEMEEFSAPTDAPPKVFLPSMNATLIGKVEGTSNRTIEVYQGIKYGISDRFKHSFVADRYWGPDPVLEVTSAGAECPQVSKLGGFIGSEDCLFLDIYVPRVEPVANSTNQLLPVMVYIHGGAFTEGETSFYEPIWIMEEDVIVVVIQYRLGTLGWLSLQNDDIPGNAGLSDQITALKWVQQNIAAFGGDPAVVTLFGQSAGAASASLLHAIGPVTRGLFSRVIAQSGSALAYWAIDKNPLESATTFATEFCKCPNATDSSSIFKCLSALTTESIASCTHDMVSEHRLKGELGVEGCAPVVQGTNMSYWNRLITKMPREYITEGEALDVPLMIGATRDEGSFILGYMFASYLAPKNLDNDPDYLANRFIQEAIHAYGVEETVETVKEKYFPGVNMTSFENMAPGMIDFLGVIFVKNSTYETAKLYSAHYNSSTFFYSFDYETLSFILDVLLVHLSEKTPIKPGVTHTEELRYLFYLLFALPNSDEHSMNLARMVTLWTNFAKYGDPTPPEETNYLALQVPRWPELGPEKLCYLLMEEDFHVAVNYTDRWTYNMDLLNETETVHSNWTYAKNGSSALESKASPEIPADSAISSSLFVSALETTSTLAHLSEITSSETLNSAPNIAVTPTVHNSTSIDMGTTILGTNAAAVEEISSSTTKTYVGVATAGALIDVMENKTLNF